MHFDFFEIGIRELATVRRGQLLYCNAFPIIVAFRNRAVWWQRCVGRSGLKNRRKSFPKMGFFAVFIKQKCDFIFRKICRVCKISVYADIHKKKAHFQNKRFPQNLSSGVLFILIWYTKKGRNLSRVSKNDLNYWYCIYLYQKYVQSDELLA